MHRITAKRPFADNCSDRSLNFRSKIPNNFYLGKLVACLEGGLYYYIFMYFSRRKL